MKKRTLALLLCLCLTAGLLTACAESAPQPKKTQTARAEKSENEDYYESVETPTPTPEPTPEPEPEDPYKEIASDVLSEALKLTDTGAAIAEAMADTSYALAAAYTENTEDQGALLDYYDVCSAQEGELGKCFSSLEALQNSLSADADSDMAKAYKRELTSLLKEIKTSFNLIQEMIDFYQEQADIYLSCMDFDTASETDEETIAYLQNYYNALVELYTEYSAMSKPDLVRDIWNKNTDRILLAAQSMEYSYAGLTTDSPIDTYVFLELTDYNATLETRYDAMALRTMGESFNQTAEAFTNVYAPALSGLKKACAGWTDPSLTRSAEPVFEYAIIDEIYPNGYSNLDSIINLTASTAAKKQDVIITAQITGFTQEYRQKVTLTTRPQHLMIKPPVLIDLPDLSNQRSTQLTFTITDNDTGKILVQENKNITIHSLYDFIWYNDEFGFNSAFDLLAWLRPESEAVSIINRQAIDYLSSLGLSSSLVGYQYDISSDEEINTLCQVAAIQKAISDFGIRYTMDNYSFGGQQHVLTPDQVLAKKSGLCIESVLLMASCLMSAGFHVYILLIPGHAQLAVESWRSGTGRTGKYFLVETTALPYEGIAMDGNYISFGSAFPNEYDPSVSWWTSYLSGEEGDEYYDGDVIVIDCDLRSLMHMQGLESVQAKLNVDPVIYPGGTGSAIMDAEPAEVSSEVEEQTSAAAEDATGTESESTDVSSEYMTVTSNKGDFSFVAKATVTGTIYENSVVIYPLGNNDLPLMLVSRVEDYDAAAFLEDWMTMLKDDETVEEKPTEYDSGEFEEITYYILDYFSTDESGILLENVVVTVQASDGSVAVFYLMLDPESDEASQSALLETFYLALYTFNVNA